MGDMCSVCDGSCEQFYGNYGPRPIIAGPGSLEVNWNETKQEFEEIHMSSDMFAHMLMYREQKKELQEKLRKAGVLARDISGRTLQELRLMAASLRIEA